MTSQDYVTVEVFNNGIITINNRFDQIEKQLGEIKAEIKVIDKNVLVNTVRIEELHHSMNWGITSLGVIVAIVGLTVTLAPVIRGIFKNMFRPTVTLEQVQEVVDNAISKALSNLGK